MATKIVTKNSSTASAVPTASDLVQGELAVNVADKRLFTEDNGGSIVELGTKPSTIDINAGSIDGTAIGASSASTGAFTTLTATGLTVNNTTAFSYLPVSTAGSVVGTIGTGSGTIFNTPSVNASFGSGLAIDGSYSSDVSTINLKAFGPKFSSYSSQLVFHTSSGTSLTERMRISSSGKVGIGTTSPLRALDVRSGTTDIVANFESSDAGAYLALQDNSTSSNTAVLVGAIGDALRIDTGDTEAMRIDSSGNVGIGTSSPSFVTGSGLEIQRSSADATLRLEHTGQHSFELTAESGQVTYNSVSSKNHVFEVGSSEKMRIDSSGNLLVGKTATALGTAGHTFGNDGYLYHTRSGDIMWLNRLGGHGTCITFMKDGATVGTISTNANSLPSDRNFKRNIQDLTLGLDFVESLNPVTYNFKIDDEGQAVMTGLIAQEVEEALTAAGVEKNSMTLLQHKPTEDVNESDYKMDYLKFVPILINSIKEQQTLIESLTARIAALEE